MIFADRSGWLGTSHHEPASAISRPRP